MWNMTKIAPTEAASMGLSAACPSLQLQDITAIAHKEQGQRCMMTVVVGATEVGYVQTQLQMKQGVDK